ncbi:MAG: preprotein translocase subunit SecG [Chitinophagaceae bacterium]
MIILLIVLIVLASVFLGLFILVQSPKDSTGFSANNPAAQIMGVKNAADFFEKGTWIIICSIVILSIFSTVFIKSSQPSDQLLRSIKTPQKTSQPQTPNQILN